MDEDNEVGSEDFTSSNEESNSLEVKSSEEDFTSSNEESNSLEVKSSEKSLDESSEESFEGEEGFSSDSAAEILDKTFENKEIEDQERVEAVLFISAKLLTFQELLTLTDVNPIMLKGILHTLEKKYSKGAIRLVNRGNSWKMDVAEKYNYLINKLATGSSEFTKAEQETLAVIAYKQPMKQSVLIKIRGNKAYDHLKKFKDLKLVDSKKAGHTYEIHLSEDFYSYFNVNKKGFASSNDDSDSIEAKSSE